jgi:hypothetical protein
MSPVNEAIGVNVSQAETCIHVHTHRCAHRPTSEPELENVSQRTSKFKNFTMMKIMLLMK